MPVTIEDVLALLPEMFPGIQQIPLKNVSPNPNNPGPPLTAQQIQDLAQNIAEVGLLNPIKVRPNKANPLAGGAQLHPSNPRLRADGQPWTVGDFNYETLTGVNRYWAFDYLKREAIPGSILNPTAKEAVKISHLDNNVRERGWWAAYQTIEQYIQADSNLTQRQIGIELGMDKDKVGRALGLLPLLNAKARDLIVCNADNSNKGIRGISERAAAQLAGLGPGTGLKPGVKAAGAETQKLWPYPTIPLETQDLVRRSLEVAIDQEMGEVGVKGLVAWVQDGHKPEEYPPKGQGLAASAEDDQGTSGPKPVAGKSQYVEHMPIDIQRIRVHRHCLNHYYSDEVEKRALSLQAFKYYTPVKVRPLTEQEKAQDTEHDFELFYDGLTLDGAKKLGWSTLEAYIYEIDEMEAIRLKNSLDFNTSSLTWVELYASMENMLKDNPKNTVAELAIVFEEDVALAEEVIPVMKLLNESTREAIYKSIRNCLEGRVDMGGYRFYPEFAVPLARLEGLSDNLSETQKTVEEVVEVAIEKEMGSGDIEELVDWVLDGNAPGEFYLEEAEG
jgi:ParB-like chromosome segregation protein Spo0J